MSLRPVRGIFRAQPAIDGAGVELHRVFGHGTVQETDPFLLLDDFRRDDPAKKVPAVFGICMKKCFVLLMIL